jgi:ribose-phosphate pyrophosphokinase
MELQFFALKGSENLGTKISDHLEIPPGIFEERVFEDGEFKIRTLENVRNRTVFVLSSPYQEKTLSLHDKIMRLLFFISNLKESSAKEVIAVMPYLPYGRKDRKTKSRDPISLKYLARLLETSGLDKIITLDAHNESAFQNAFRIPTEHIEGANLFIPHILRLTQGEDLVIAAPDVGGIKRALRYKEKLRKYFDAEIPLAFTYKTRSEGIIQTYELSGNVKDKTVVIVDDLISSGFTLTQAAEMIKKAGARKVIACITHALISDVCFERLLDLNLSELLVSDSIQIPSSYLKGLGHKISVIDSSDLLSRVMKRMTGGDSVVELQESYSELYLNRTLQA